MKRLAVLLVVATPRCSPPPREGASTGQLHDQPFSRVQVSGDRVYVRYVLDLAEIPTFQARHDRRRRLRQPARGRRAPRPSTAARPGSSR